MTKLKIAGINFDHMHMGDNLRMAFEHPDAEIVGICDAQPERMQAVARSFQHPARACFHRLPRLPGADAAGYRHALPRHGRARADGSSRSLRMARTCWSKSHSPPRWTEADRMIRAVAASRQAAGDQLAAGLVSAACHRKRLIDEGMIGEVIEVHYYDGNRGPLGTSPTRSRPRQTVRAQGGQLVLSKAKGGGSLLDYLGYGTTLGTWYHGGAHRSMSPPSSISRPAWRSMSTASPSRAMPAACRNSRRAGARLPIRGRSSRSQVRLCDRRHRGDDQLYDYESTIRVQTRAQPAGETLPVDTLVPPYQNPVQYLIHCISSGEPISGPLSPEISRIGQQIVDSAVLSAREQRTVALLG